MKKLDNVKCEARAVHNFYFDHQLNVSQDEDQKNDSVKESAISLGGFLDGGEYAWISHANRLIVFNSKTCELQSLWSFSTNVSCVVSLPSLPGEIPLLLVGLDNSASRMRDSVGMLCVYDCSATRVLRAIRMPAGVEQVCVLQSNKEENVSSEIFKDQSGLVFIALRDFQHLIIDLKRCDWENASPYSANNESNPAEIELLPLNHSIAQRNSVKSDKHSAYNLMTYQIEKFLKFSRSYYDSHPLAVEKFTTVCRSSHKIDCFLVGCLGRIIAWQNDGSIRWISENISEDSSITHLALLEPIDDPKPFFYLAAVYQDTVSPSHPVVRMFTMAFERKTCENGINYFRNLEGDPCVKFEIELEEDSRVVSLQALERDSHTEKADFLTRGEECLLFIGTENRMMLFDLNQWYKEHMPCSLLECANPNSIAAVYQMQSQNITNDELLDYYYVPSSLKQFQRFVDNQREELFYPNSLSIEWMELRMKHLVFWESRGVQAELLKEIENAGSIILQQPTEAYHRCLSIGLIPFNSKCNFESSVATQREILLSICLEQKWIPFLVKCAREWSDGSASLLFPTFLKWAIQRATTIKQVADRYCVSLFDHSRLDIDESEVRVIRFCCKQLEWLSTILSKLPSETVDLTSQQQALKRVSTYLDVLLWFNDFSLLPEFSEHDYDNDSLPPRILYPYSKLREDYASRRAEARRNIPNIPDEEEQLFIDEFISLEFPNLKEQWKKEGGDGNYPPASLQSILRMFLVELDKPQNEEMNIKHQIMTYLLIDVATYYENSPDVENLIKYPMSFNLRTSLIKLVQSFYLLDHKDYLSFQEIMDKYVPNSVMKDWHHRLIIKALLSNNQHNMAMNYLRVRKPPLSSLGDEEILIDLTVKHGLVNTAFNYRPPSHYSQLLTCFFKACKTYGKLAEILPLNLSTEEEEAFVKFLDKNKCEDFRLLYNVQHCHYTNNQHSWMEKDNQSMAMQMVNAYHATLPNIVKRFRACAGKNVEDTNHNCSFLKPLSHSSNRNINNKSRDICEVLMEKTLEFNRKITGLNRNYVPFVSAPSVSLKPDNNLSAYFVEYAEKKTTLKRKLDRTISEDNVQAAKKFKSNETTPKSPEPANNGALEASMRTFTSTPLVERCKTPLTSARKIREPTPHSILKIRQLIHRSSLDNDSFQENRRSLSQEKNPRQIRFQFVQEDSALSNDLEEEKPSTEEMSPLETPFEPNFKPKPRPSLRRSHSSVIESTNESTENISKRHSLRYSLLNNTVYRDPILSNDTNIEFSIREKSVEKPVSLNLTEDDLSNDVSQQASKSFSSSALQKTVYMESILTSDTDMSESEYVPILRKLFPKDKPSEEQLDTKNKVQESNQEDEDVDFLGEKLDQNEVLVLDNDKISVNVDDVLERTQSRKESENFDESFESVSESLNDEAFEDTTDKISIFKSKPVVKKNRQTSEEFNITDDESVQNAEDSEEKDVEVIPPISAIDKNKFLEANITDDESNDSLIFVKSNKTKRAKSREVEIQDKTPSVLVKFTKRSINIPKEKIVEPVVLKVREPPVEKKTPSKKSLTVKGEEKRDRRLRSVSRERSMEPIAKEKTPEPVTKEEVLVEPVIPKSPSRKRTVGRSKLDSTAKKEKEKTEEKKEEEFVIESIERSISKEKAVEASVKEQKNEEIPLTKKSTKKKPSTQVKDTAAEEKPKEKKTRNVSRDRLVEPTEQSELRTRRSVSRDRSVEPIEQNGVKKRRASVSRAKSETQEKETEVKEEEVKKRTTRRRAANEATTEPAVKEEPVLKETVKKRAASKKQPKTTKKVEEEKQEEDKETKRSLRSRSQPPEELSSSMTTRSRRAQSVTADTPESETKKPKSRSSRAQSISLDTVSETEPLVVKSQSRSRRAQSEEPNTSLENTSLRRTRSSSSLFKAKEKVSKTKRQRITSLSEPILEESIEERVNEVVKQLKTTTKKKTTSSRKKKVSESSSNNDENEMEFQFSLPENQEDVSNIDEAHIHQTERFEFSPPHTRSRHPSKRK